MNNNNNNFFPLANAYPTYGRYEPPGPGVRPITAPLANHIVSSTTEADEIDYPVEAAYRMSVPMYESQIASYPYPPNPSPAPLQPVGVNSPPRSFREGFNNSASAEGARSASAYPSPPVGVNSPPRSFRVNYSAPAEGARSASAYPSPPVGVNSPPRSFREGVNYSAPASGGVLANNVLDYNKLQGTNNPTDLSIQILRDTNYRYITLQNSSYRPIGIGITTYYTGTIPSIRFIVEPGITRYLGINSQGEPAQYAWPLDPETGKQVGNPSILSAISNDFVLRDGINGWKMQKFTRPSYRAAF